MSPTYLRICSADELPTARRDPVDAPTLAAARQILDDIERRREIAVLEYARRFGDLSGTADVVLERDDLVSALGRVPASLVTLLERTADRIKRFAIAQRQAISDIRVPLPGGFAGHDCIPVSSAACYAPGGRYPLPSSVLMTALPARVAGVSELVVLSPRPHDSVLAAAAIAGVERLLTIGGVQGIAAATLGLFGLTPADVVVGPGNKWVTAAKQLVSSSVGIDMLAGPSELVVIADESADPELVAADLLAQAEHDPDALPVLISSAAEIVDRVNRSLDRQLETLPTAEVARASLRGGFALVAETRKEMAELADRLAPEHLEIITRDAGALAASIRNAGAVFVGRHSGEVLGDYGAGPNHVLPTGRSARFRGGLSVFSFLRVRTWIRIDDPSGAAPLARDAADFARIERLEAHARAAEIRVRGIEHFMLAP